MDIKLEKLRKQIDLFDEKIIDYLGKRMKIANRIGKLKKENNISALDKARWKKILKSNTKKGEALGLSEQFIKDLSNLIHNYSLKIQEKS